MRPKVIAISGIAGFCFFMLLGSVLGGLAMVPVAHAQVPYTQAVNLPTNPTVPTQSLTKGVINANERHIFYWVQVSDVHINAERDLERLHNLDRLCSYVNSTIQPAFVIASGDIADAREETIFMFYAQDENEYRLYNQTLQKYGFGRDYWFTMLGNHERYDTRYNYSLFQAFMRNETQYAVDFNPGFGQYRFVMLDSTQQYGMKTNFELYGEMQVDKMTHFVDLLSYDNPAGINQTVIFQHHPVYEVMSENLPDGRNFQHVLRESGAQYVFTGHIHYPNLYVNRGSYAEAHCPSLKDRVMYRIAAFDNDIASFSDVDLDHWPQIVVTNPTDARFYNPNMPLARMAAQNEIRVLLFDNATITSAYAEIDGRRVGDLVYQGQNLWAVPYNPQEYAVGNHKLTIHASSAHGNTVKEVSFQLSGFVPAPTTGNAIWVYYAAPLSLLVFMLVLALAVIGFGRLVPQVVRVKRSRPLKSTPPANEGGEGMPEIAPVKKPTRGLSVPLFLSSLLMIAYPFAGPLLVGEFNTGLLGAVFFNQVFIGFEYVLDVSTVFFAAILLFSGVLIEAQFLRKKAEEPGRRVRGKIPLIAGVVVVAIYLGFNAIYFGALTVVLSPALYIYCLLPIFLKWKKYI